MKIETNWNVIPSHTFRIKDMMKPVDIIDYMSDLDIKYYLYEIRCKNITVKFGMSAAETTRPGERIYRQIGHLSSWGNYSIYGQNGIDFIAINDHFRLKYGFDMDHNDISVTIWNFDNYSWKTIDKQYELEKAEQYLIQNYNNLYKELPVGNLYDYNPFGKKSAPNLEAFRNNFDFEEL